MVSNSDLRKKIREYLASIKRSEDVYGLFKVLNYPKEAIFDPSYVKKIKEFSFASEEREKVKSIYTVMSYDKLNVFLIETTSLNKPLMRYITNKFAEMYTRCLLILTVDYKEIHIVFPDYEKKEVGKHKLKTTTLILKKDELYYTDIEIICNIFLEDQKKTWREMWRLWKDAFNVQKVTEDFFEDYKLIFFVIRKELKKQKVDTKIAHEFTLQFLNRIMFIYFIAKKEWLNKDRKFMQAYWDLYKRISKYGNNEFYDKWLKPLFFEAFNNKSNYHPELPEEVNRILSNSPYLNGGLFTKKIGLDDLKINISDNLFKEIFDFFESYNFTIKEDSVLDVEVSVDPQMIGYVYESLANITEDVYENEEDLRGDWGIFYTAKVEVDFMCRRSLVEYLGKNLEIPKEELYEFVFDEDKEKIEKKFNQRKCWGKIEEALDNLSIVDPACGSGAFLVGMLNVLVELYKIVFKYEKKSFDDFQVKYKIIQRSLYGVDVMPWAIHAAELRLWLQLIVETVIPEDKLRKNPLLPNLDLNLRVGDSLVQEIGGFSFNVRSNDLKPHLKKKLKELQYEKREYFANAQLAKTPEDIKKKEIKLFDEILDERIDMLTSDIGVYKKDTKEKQTGLFGATVNIEAKNISKEKEKLEELEKKIEENQKEIEKLKKVKELLKDPAQKPFVWDIDFAEVFADEGGFDIVIGNPPYVRQEKIAPPNKLKEEITLEDRREYKEKLIKSVQNRFPVVFDWDKKSDLYVYFYFHGLSLLNSGGVFCFITSNSWLDVGYGKGLQEFLLRYSSVIGIYDNQAKRSFEHADVNTIIALLGAPVIGKQKSLFEYGAEYNGNGKATYSGFSKMARFVMFKKPFEEVVNAANLVKIEKAEKILKTNEFRVYPINHEDLLEDGWEYPEGYENGRFGKGSYEGNKWGGKYLRASDLLITLLAKETLCSISPDYGVVSTVAWSREGKNTEVIKSKDEIRKEGKCYPLLKSPKDTSKILITPDDLKFCLVNLEKLQNKPKIASILLDDLRNDKHLCRKIVGDIFFTHAFHAIKENNKEDIDLICGVLNGTLAWFIIENIGRRGLGGGAIRLVTNDLKRIKIFPERKSLEESAIKKIKKFFLNLAKRHIKSCFEECGIDPTKPIREQEPKPLPDRAELDNIIFDELGLTKEERKEVYLAVCELVQQRLSKATSLKEK